MHILPSIGRDSCMEREAMEGCKETAGKTAGANGIGVTEDANGVTVRITGEAYARLRAIAGALGASGWLAGGCSAAQVVEEYALGLCDPCALVEAVISSVDYGAEEGSAEWSARREGLAARLDRALA